MNMGQSPASSSYNKEKKGIPFFQGNADFGPLHPVTRFYCSEPTKIAHANDILLSVRAPIGAVNIAEEDCCIGRGLAGLTPHTDVSLKYLYYVLLGKNDELNFKGTGCTFKAINKKSLGETSFPLPPLKEQKRIADILDKAAELISLRKQQIEKLDLLVKSKFIDMFGDPVTNPKGWPRSKLTDFYSTDGIKCGPFGSALKKSEYVDTGVPVWNMDNISKTGRFRNTPHLWIQEDKFHQLSSYNVQNGDIIISRAGTVGKMCVVDTSFPRSIISTNLIRLRLNSKLSPLYVVTLITTYGSRVCRLRTGGDDAFSYMNTGVLNSVMFPYPPIKLQNEFAAFVEKVEKQKTQMQTGLEKLELNYKALMVEFFEGE